MGEHATLQVSEIGCEGATMAAVSLTTNHLAFGLHEAHTLSTDAALSDGLRLAVGRLRLHPCPALDLSKCVALQVRAAHERIPPPQRKHHLPTTLSSSCGWLASSGDWAAVWGKQGWHQALSFT